jgi:hypothetical protein
MYNKENYVATEKVVSAIDEGKTRKRGSVRRLGYWEKGEQRRKEGWEKILGTQFKVNQPESADRKARVLKGNAAVGSEVSPKG